MTPRQYHALVAYSGGKDSTFLIYRLKQMYDLNILALTLDNGFISPLTFTNMSKVLAELKVDHIVFKPNIDIMRRVVTLSANEEVYPLSLLKAGSSVCISCIRMVINAALRTALEKKIPIVVLGNSPGQVIRSENELIYQDNRIPYTLKKQLFRALIERAGGHIEYYLMLDKEDYKTKPFPHTVNPLPIMGYDEGTIYKTIADLGWQKPKDVDACSTNCRLNSYGIVKHIEQMNFHPYDYEMSILVRTGKLSREAALERINSSREVAERLARQIVDELE